MSQYYPEPDDVADDTWEMPIVHNRSGVAAPVGEYVCTFDGMVKETNTRFTEYTRMRIDWKVRSVVAARERAKARECVGKNITAWANLTLGPKATLRAWVEAMLDRELREGEKPTIEQLMGLPVIVNVIPYESEDGTKLTKVGAITAYHPADLDEDQRPRDVVATRDRVPADAPRATAAEMSGKRPAARAADDAVTHDHETDDADDDPEPWDGEDDEPPGAVDPVLAARAAKARR